jgi:hypothetical protein
MAWLVALKIFEKGRNNKERRLGKRRRVKGWVYAEATSNHLPLAFLPSKIIFW